MSAIPEDFVNKTARLSAEVTQPFPRSKKIFFGIGGFIGGLFLTLYGSFRFFVEFYRAPDVTIGFDFFGWMTRGQLLSLPMIIIGIIIILWSYSCSGGAMFVDTLDGKDVDKNGSPDIIAVTYSGYAYLLRGEIDAETRVIWGFDVGYGYSAAIIGKTNNNDSLNKDSTPDIVIGGRYYDSVNQIWYNYGVIGLDGNTGDILWHFEAPFGATYNYHINILMVKVVKEFIP